jgi:tripartite ATP-independent transporter DctP family solute receptor
MKKMFLFVLCAAGILLSGCKAKQETAAPAAETRPLLIQIGYENNPGEPIDLGCQEWKKLIEEKSGGSIKVELFPSSQLGSKTDLIDQMVAGDAVITIADGAFYAERGVPDFGIVFGPYLFETWDECWKLTASDWYAEQCGKLEQNGIKLLASNWVYGERHTLTKKPVHSPADLKGVKIRVASSNIFIKGFEALGASPTPMALAEVYTALQQGAIEGLENPLSVLYNGKYQEVAKYLILDGHVKSFTTWCIGTTFFNSLSKEHQQILLDTAHEAGIRNNQFQAEAETKVRDLLKADGVIIYTPTAEEMRQFRQAARQFYEYPEINGKWTPGLYETVNAILR